MKAILLEEIGKLAVRDVPEPELDDDSALVRIEAVSVCGSDVRILHNGNPRIKMPAIIGHEAAGVVTAVGKNVDRIKPGQRVAIGADVPCGRCSWCRNGLGNNCQINYAVGYQIPGAFSQTMKLPRLLMEEGPIAPFADHVSFEEAALAEPLGCAINGFELAHMAMGKNIVIIGMGPIGCMMIDVARAMGALRTIVVELDRGRMEIARQYEPDVCIFPDEEDVIARCRDETGGRGPDVVITACPSVEVHEQAIEMVAHRGYVNLFGGLGKDIRPLSVLSNTIHYKECFVTGSHGCVPRHHELAMRLIEAGKVRVKPIITHHFPIAEAQEAFDMMESKKGMKVVIHPQDAS